MTSDLHIFPDAAALARGAAEDLARAVQQDARQKSRISLVLSGGHTPRELYRCLASDYRDRISWGKLQFFWGDERYVPNDHPQSNFRMAKECLLDPLEIPAGQVHPIPTSAQNPEEAAQAYESYLRQFFAGASPQFDIVLLGLG